jgi:hypothetical protein
VSATRYVPPAERTSLELFLQIASRRQTRLTQFTSNLKVVQKPPAAPVVYDGR